MDSIEQLSLSMKIDPSQFDLTIGAMLLGIGAEKYIDIFRKRNIGQSTLVELTDGDLQKLGVDDGNIRSKLLEEIKNLPIYEECVKISNIETHLSDIDIIQILHKSSLHLHKIHLSTLANSLALQKHKNLPDCLLYRDKFASDIALSTINEINTILNSMDLIISTDFEVNENKPRKSTHKKIIIGTLGTAAVGVLSVLFIRSLMNL